MKFDREESMKKFVCTIITALCALSLYAQEPDTQSIRVDSLFVTGLEEMVADLSRVSPADTTLLLRAPETVTRDFDGATWWSYDLGGAVLSVDVRYEHRYGNYYRVGVNIVNTSPEGLDFDFDAIRMNSGDRPIRVYTREEYLRRVHRKQNWRNFGAQIAMVPLYLFALAAAERITDFNDDGWHSLGESVAEGIAYGIINEAAMIGSDLIASHYEGHAQQIFQDNMGYLGDCRIAPDHALQGHFYARFDPSAREVTIEIPVGGKTCRIPFLAVGLPEVGKELD